MQTMIETFLIELIILLYILTQTISTSKKIMYLFNSGLLVSLVSDALFDLIPEGNHLV